MRLAGVLTGAAVGVAALTGFAVGRHGAATSPLAATEAGGPVVARFRGGTVSRARLESEIAKLPEVVRASLKPSAARKAFAERIVQVEVLAHEAERRDLQKDPEFARRYREALGKFYVERVFEEPQRKAVPTDEEIRSFYDANRKALGRPERVRVAVVTWTVPDGDAAARAAKQRKAEAALARLRAKNDAATFAALVQAESEDRDSRSVNGELSFATREELSKRLGPESAEAAFAVTGKDGLVPRVLGEPRALHVVKVLGREEGYEPGFEELKEPIRARLAAERRAKAYDAFVEKTSKEAGVAIDEKALAEVNIE